MRCHGCLRMIGSGVEASRMICTYTQDDGTELTFGFQMPAGPVARATGRLKNGWHNKCWHAARKREARGGRVLGAGVDTEDTYQVSGRLAELEQIATEVGKPVGDPTVSEAYRARQHGGPYSHAHTMPLDTYQLMAHLRYAHGIDPETTDILVEIHVEAHARQAAAIHLRARADDPDPPPAETDWRESVAIHVEAPAHSISDGKTV